MRASSMRRRWPPERVFSGWSRMRSGRFRLDAMDAASASAAYPPSRWNRSSSRPYVFIAASETAESVLAMSCGRLLHAQHDGAEPAGVEDARARQVVEVAGARILRQVPDLAGAIDRAGVRQEVAGEHLGQRGLTGAVAPDQSDLVAVGDAEAHVLHEDARANAQFEAVDGKH